MPKPTPGLTGPAAAKDVAFRVEVILASEQAIDEAYDGRNPFDVHRDFVARIRAAGVLFGIPFPKTEDSPCP